MTPLLAHAAAGEGLFALFAGAAGGLHNALALAASGLAARHRGSSGLTLPTLGVSASVAAGVAGGWMWGLAVGSHVGPVAAMVVGLALVLRERSPAWLLQVAITVFGVAYGLGQFAHFVEGAHAASASAVLSSALATAGSYAAGLFAAWATEEASSPRGGAALGAGVAVAAGLPLIG